MKLLIIEDDRETAAYLVKGLSESGYTVDHANDGRNGLFLATSDSYDAIVLDRMLPGMDGLALLGALRGAQIRTPALILSALGSVDDRVKGLRSGGDDYLVKPFAFAELLARVRVLLRRGSPAETMRKQVGDLVVDVENRRVTRDGEDISLTPREYELLAYLLRHQGQTVTRRMLATDVWREPHRATPLDNVIDVHVAHLRRKIDEGRKIKLIHTVRGVGFVLREENLT